MSAGRTLWIPGQLPGLNELIAAAKSGRGRGNGYARLKAQWTEEIAIRARAAGLWKWPSGASFRFRWVEGSKRRDPDNFTGGGRKLILDGLVLAGVLPDDSWRYVDGFTDAWEAVGGLRDDGSRNDGPGVEVILSAGQF